jgi:hypothetical protein
MPIHQIGSCWPSAWTLTDDDDDELELEDDLRTASKLASKLASSGWKAAETGVGCGAEFFRVRNEKN